MGKVQFKKMPWERQLSLWIGIATLVWFLILCVVFVFLGENYVHKSKLYIVAFLALAITITVTAEIWWFVTRYERRQIRQYNLQLKERMKRVAEVHRGLLAQLASLPMQPTNLKPDIEIHRVNVSYLNAAGELRVVSLAEYLQSPFHRTDKPDVVLIEGYGEYENGRYQQGFNYLCWSGIALWTIGCGLWETDPIVIDLFGEVVSINTHYSHISREMNGRITDLMRFITSHTSVADYTLKTIHDFAVPILRESKKNCSSSKIAEVRIVLQLGQKRKLFDRKYNFLQGRKLDLEGLLERDPDQN